MALVVKFGGVEIRNVTSVTPADSFSSEAIIDVASLIGARSSTIAVSGFVRKPGIGKEALLAEQNAFTESFAGKGPDTIEYPGIVPYTARLRSIEWQDWTGGPVVRFTMTFEGEAENPFAAVVKIAPKEALSPAEKTFDPKPSVADAFRNSSVLDEKPDAEKDKTITLSGILKGTLAEVTAEEAAIKTLLTADEFYVVTVSSGVYTCKVASFNFATPAGTESEATKGYQVELATLPDFSLEGRSLKGGPLSIAGVTFDVATTFSHNIGREAGGEITSESINAGGKKFFSTMALAESFKGEIDAKVKDKATFASATGKVLAVKSINWSEPKRDGHFTDGTRRYSIQFSLALAIDKSAATKLSGVVLGVSFDVLASHNLSASLDEQGFVTTESQSGSGKVKVTPSVRPGASVVEGGKKFFITSLNLGSVDDSGRRQVSVSGQTLDTAKAVEELFPSFFFGFFLDHVNSTSKSVNFSFDRCDQRFKAQSINASVSGFTIGSDKGVLNLISTINRTVGSFVITSVSTGAPEQKRRGGVLEKRFPISISGVLNLVGEQKNACEEPPDVKVEETRSVQDSVTKYTSVPIPGKGITMKKIGVTQAEETVTIRHVAKDASIFRTMAGPADPVTSLIGGEKVGRGTNTQGLTRSISVKFASFPPEVRVA